MRTFPNRALTDAEAKAALADACKQVETNLPLYTWQCQNHSSVNGIYPGCPNDEWTCGWSTTTTWASSTARPAWRPGSWWAARRAGMPPSPPPTSC